MHNQQTYNTQTYMSIVHPSNRQHTKLKREKDNTTRSCTRVSVSGLHVQCWTYTTTKNTTPLLQPMHGHAIIHEEMHKLDNKWHAIDRKPPKGIGEKNKVEVSIFLGLGAKNEQLVVPRVLSWIVKYCPVYCRARSLALSLQDKLMLPYPTPSPESSHHTIA